MYPFTLPRVSTISCRAMQSNARLKRVRACSSCSLCTVECRHKKRLPRQSSSLRILDPLPSSGKERVNKTTEERLKPTLMSSKENKTMKTTRQTAMLVNNISYVGTTYTRTRFTGGKEESKARCSAIESGRWRVSHDPRF